MYILEIRKHYRISFLRTTELRRRGRDQKKGNRKQHNGRPEDIPTSACALPLGQDLFLTSDCHLGGLTLPSPLSILQMSKQLDMFKTNLEEFASKHKQEIRKNPEFRVQFQDMCATIGVDPLACKELSVGVYVLLGFPRDRSYLVVITAGTGASSRRDCREIKCCLPV